MTTTNEIERVILNLEDRIAELQAEIQLAYTRAQNAVEEAERERDERDATIARLRMNENVYAAGIAELSRIIELLNVKLDERDATIARLREALERIAMCPTDGCDGLVHLARTALAEEPS